MVRRANSSKQTESLLLALVARPDDWRHGYDLSRETELKSGTLYPILMRLERQRWLDARWEDEPASGKPRRHLYRLTALGATEAQNIVASPSATASAPTLVRAPQGSVQ
jgi:DNA-binding PadR family transcriptional regulator